MDKKANVLALEKATINNDNYRKVIKTTKTMQLVLMSLNAGEDIPVEVHPKTTQFIRIEKGKVIVKVDNKRNLLKDGDSIIIPPGSEHYVKAIGKESVKLYTIYSPPEHRDGLTQKRQPKRLKSLKHLTQHK